ncbi:MAG: RNA polymerase sigma factor, partial [Bryobacteraceae bacterium]
TTYIAERQPDSKAILTVSEQTFPPGLDERALLAAVRRKDRKATAEFVDRHADVVFAYVKRRLAPRQDLAEDVVQEVFLDAWESLERFRGDSSVRAWLLGIARHKVQDYYRSRLRAFDAVEEDVIIDPEPPFDEALDRSRAHERVRTALARLPEIHRVVLLWRYWERLSAEEMAMQSGKTVKAVERLLAKARDRFRRCYRE